MNIAWILTALALFAFGAAAMRLYMLNSMKPDGTPPVAPSEAKPEQADVSDVSDVSGAKPQSPLLAKLAKLKALSPTHMALGAAGIAVVAAGSIALIGGHSSSDSGSATTSASTSGMGGSGSPSASPDGKIDDVDSLIRKLEEKLQKNPDDGEGWRMLGWSYVGIGQPAKAVSAYGRARKLLPNRADIEAGYGEALVGATGDKITPEAKAAFQNALKLDPKEPRARFFMALDKVQNGKEHEGLDEWITLANEVPPEAAWQPDLRQRINALATKLGVDVSGKLHNALPAPVTTVATPALSMPATVSPHIAKGPTPEQMSAAQSLPPAQQQSMVNNMVDGLANRLKANPKDVNGWIELIRSRKVLNQEAQAKSDLAIARKSFASDPASLAQVNAMAQNLGLN